MLVLRRVHIIAEESFVEGDAFLGTELSPYQKSHEKGSSIVVLDFPHILLVKCLQFMY